MHAAVLQQSCGGGKGGVREQRENITQAKARWDWGCGVLTLTFKNSKETSEERHESMRDARIIFKVLVNGQTYLVPNKSLYFVQISYQCKRINRVSASQAFSNTFGTTANRSAAALTHYCRLGHRGTGGNSNKIMNNDLGLRVHAASTLCLYAVTAEVVLLVFCVNNDLGLQHPLSLHCTSTSAPKFKYTKISISYRKRLTKSS